MDYIKNVHLGKEAIGGLSAGIVGTIIGYPLDLVKTRMQTSTTTRTGGIFHIASNVVRKEGILALYKGIAPPLLSLSILNTINFTSYSFFRELYQAERGWDTRNALAGISGAPIAGSISTIENFIKTQMQLDNITGKRFRGSWHCLTTLAQTHGVSIIYTGHLVNTTREGVFLGAYFFAYEGFRESLKKHIGISTQLAVPMAGGLAGATGWFVSFPLDCVRAGVQGRQLDTTKTTALGVFRNLIEQKGLRGLYSGISPSVARAFLVSGSRFSAYEGALWLLRKGNDLTDTLS